MSCENETSPGNVYWLGNDLSSMPFYTNSGLLAGIILGMTNPGASSEYAPFNKYILPNGTVFWGVEANFRDPQMICTNNNSNDKVGDRLWFKDEDYYYEAPITENATILNNDGWSKGACFVGMGDHWWRYANASTPCDDTYPIFLLYNSGKLNAWGIAMAHSDRPYLTSYRWEHPGGSELKWFFEPGQMPTCLPNQGTLSSQHVYMTNPLFDSCL